MNGMGQTRGKNPSDRRTTLVDFDLLVATLWFSIAFTDVGAYMAKEDYNPFSAVLVIFCLVYLLLTRDLASFFAPYLNKTTLVWCILYLLPLPLMVIADRTYDIREYTSVVAVFLAFAVSVAFAYAYDAERKIRYGITIAFVIGVCLNIFEIFFPNTFSTAPGRSAGLYINPNYSSSVIILMGLLLSDYGKTIVSGRDVLISFGLIIGVMSTFSRTNIILGTIVLLILLALRWSKKISLYAKGYLLIGLVALFIALRAMIGGGMSVDAYDRFEDLLTGEYADSYQAERGLHNESFSAMIDEAWWFGHGVQTVAGMDNGPHNQYTALHIDYGIFAVVMFVFILVFAAWNLSLLIMKKIPTRFQIVETLLAYGYLAAFCFANHNVFELKPYALFFGIACARITKANEWLLRVNK